MGIAIAHDIEWLVDTGAEIAVVRQTVGRLFRTNAAIGVSASPTTGGGGILVVAGIEAEFTVETWLRQNRVVREGGYVGVKSSDAHSDLLGMQQVAASGAKVVWDPATRAGALRVGPCLI